MIAGAKNIHVAKGKKMVEFSPLTENRDTILKQIIGPSGNLRAPTFRIGNDYIVGFNEQMYSDRIL